MANTALSLVPPNRNFLSPIPYMLLVRRLPNVDFFVQKINLPGMTSQPAIQPTNFSNIPWSGVKLHWNPLKVTFKVDENLNNWGEIFNWLVAINLAVDTTGYAQLASHPSFTGLGIESEMILVLHDDERQPQKNVVFHGAFPIALDDLNFDSTLKDVEYVTATATFIYTNYDLDVNI